MNTATDICRARQDEIAHQNDIDLADKRLSLASDHKPVKQYDAVEVQEHITEGVMNYVYPAEVMALKKDFAGDTKIDLHANDEFEARKKSCQLSQDLQVLRAIENEDHATFFNILSERIKEDMKGRGFRTAEYL